MAKFIWEAEDIVNGLRIIQPRKGTTATIGWFGTSGEQRSVVMETNTDGMVWGQHKKGDNDDGLFHDENGELVFIPFTNQELADRLNKATYPWFPASVFTGTGVRLITKPRGGYRDEFIGLKKLDEIKG